jgi:hypothetical protein
MTNVRRWLLAALVLGLAGSAVELVFLEHYLDGWQMTPIVLIVAAMLVLGWYLVKPSSINATLFRVTMVLFVVAGFVGLVLHMQGAAEFQREIDPAMDYWTLFTKVLHAKAPPAFAPGLMIQLGLIGMAFSFSKETVR